MTILSQLRAIGEETRLRIVMLLSLGELTVADLVGLLDQSQPRISRHLKLLAEAGVIERFPEGAQVLCRVSRDDRLQSLITAILDRIDQDTPPYQGDIAALADLKKAQSEQASAYFADHAQDWGYLRGLYVEEAKIEAALKKAAGSGPFSRHLDLGTGTGQLIDLFSPVTEQAVGLDNSRAMLAIARSRLNPGGDSGIEIRHAHIEEIPQTLHGQCDLVTLHMVLCYVSDPGEIIQEARKTMTSDGVLLIADFLPHEREELRKERAHRRLGLSEISLQHAAEKANLAIVSFEIFKGDGLDVFVAQLSPGGDTHPAAALS